MDQKTFKRMWEDMQREGYFSNHPHYSDHFGTAPTAEEEALDAAILALDFDACDITMPIPYSDVLERSVKRTEAQWLYRMFDLPRQGTAYDVGCGFGRSLRWLSQVYDRVIGSDISAEVIAQAGELLADFDNIALYVNEADALPAEIDPGTIDVAYIFTVFQHIPREYSERLLQRLAPLLDDAGKVVFNLLSNVNEELNEGLPQTEWAIGYSEAQAHELVTQAGLKLDRLVRWSRPETEISWLWISAKK